jgi:hypothetical protein
MFFIQGLTLFVYSELTCKEYIFYEEKDSQRNRPFLARASPKEKQKLPSQSKPLQKVEQALPPQKY